MNWTQMPEPGIHLVHENGEKNHLAGEEGAGDRELLVEALAEYLTLGEVMDVEAALLDQRAEEVKSDARGPD